MFFLQLFAVFMVRGKPYGSQQVASLLFPKKVSIIPNHLSNIHQPPPIGLAYPPPPPSLSSPLLSYPPPPPPSFSSFAKPSHFPSRPAVRPGWRLPLPSLGTW